MSLTRQQELRARAFELALRIPRPGQYSTAPVFSLSETVREAQLIERYLKTGKLEPVK